MTVIIYLRRSHVVTVFKSDQIHVEDTPYKATRQKSMKSCSYLFAYLQKRLEGEVDKNKAADLHGQEDIQTTMEAVTPVVWIVLSL